MLLVLDVDRQVETDLLLVSGGEGGFRTILKTRPEGKGPSRWEGVGGGCGRDGTPSLVLVKGLLPKRKNLSS